jgi:sodium-dependent dicarboxylate transporter 2/3/5
MQTTAALLALMIIWWVSEAVPIPVTALLPGLLLPLLGVTGTQPGGSLFTFDTKAAFASYSNPVIFLFLAGFLLAGAMRKTGLDRRITLSILSWRAMMRGPGMILLVVMGVTTFFSMWMSNTATAAMMLPIAVTILRQLGQQPGTSPFGAALMMGVGWSASIGGVATIIGTPPNGIVVGILRNQHIADIDFLQWMKIGMPVTLLCFIGAWALLMLVHRPKIGDTSAGHAAVLRARAELPRPSVDEIAVLLVFSLVVLLWVAKPIGDQFLPADVRDRLSRLDDNEIGLLGAILLFVVPIDRRGWRTVLDWHDAKYVEWGTLVLFGGGIALSDAMFKTGLTDWLASGFVGWIGHPGPWVSLTLIVLLIIFLTEVTSNTAVASMMTPVLIGLASKLGTPAILLCVAGGLASSLGFMLPVGTPPNALVYGTGYFRISQMARASFWMNLLSAALVVACLYFLAGRLFGALPIE